MKSMKGFTLIELMVAVVIGVFLVTGLMNLFITMNRSVTLSDAMSQNQETGRFAMDYLTQFTRQAGYTDSPSASGSIDPLFTAPDCTLDGACTENNPNTIRGDRVSLQMYVASGNQMQSCTGSIIDGPRKFANVFWVSADAGSDRELRCRTVDTDTNTWIDQSAVSIVSNIELLELQVGVAADPTHRHASRYINMETFNPIDNTIGVSSIRSIKLGILTTSQTEDNAAQTNIKERKYVVLDSPVLTFNDGALRSIFSNTIELPNAIESAFTN
ncbi:prepilin-type N-terminal cleavage/methylation domain-containing protein [Bermanella marisrubri]|uniref:Pilin like competence factor n=1 Tax=Bermanella marisrubri TaxID=207949 RepID=Q1MYR8_9GAMM|nr:PilW family protein [Bermanella marisrubri]EAT11138.1 pilin like competence factor [Oceanobacter sp. RED65] [Bermanella marisrubri]QIZ85755.1 prepilin-type N-terminal cleavage/methylation domain-containing protein [Bermanella marisrubri]